jgi:hypothetical protein
MNIIGADGLEGSVSTPMAMPMRLFSQGVVVQKGLLGRQTQAITFIENGSISFSAEASAAPKTNEIMGTFTAPVAYCFPDYMKQGNDVRKRVQAVLKMCNELYLDKFRISNGFESNGEMAKMVDVLIETVPRVGREEILIYMDRDTLVIEQDDQFKSRQDDLFQDIITSKMTGIREIPVTKLIGYGLIRDNWTKIKRPNKYIRVAPRTVLKVGKISNDFTKTEWQIQAFYMHMLAEALNTWLGEAFPALEMNDWVALANIWIGGIAQYGATDREQKWAATDIEVSVNMMPGFGWTEASRFLWGNVNTVNDFKMYYMVMNLLGFVAQRTKGAMLDLTVKKEISSNDWMVPTRFKRAMQPNIDSWGSNDAFFFLMPRNNFSFGERVDIPWPCLVDETNLEGDQIIKKANNYEDLLPFRQQTWKDVTIDRGEVPQGAVNEASNETTFMRLHATTDARIVKIVDTNSMFVRSITQYRFPMRHIVANGMERIDRLRLWLWGVFANGEKGMKNAYIIESSLDIFKVQMVNYRRGPLDTQIVDKEGTQTVGDQIVKPGTIPYAPNMESVGIASQDIKPPRPEKKAPHSQKVFTTKSGDEIREVVTDESVENENVTGDDASNNTPEETS